MSEQNAHKHSFQAEVAQLLHLVTHSLYSNPDIFLRESQMRPMPAINCVLKALIILNIMKMTQTYMCVSALMKPIKH